MNTVLSQELREVLETVNYRPAVSMIIPFETRISVNKELALKLKLAIGEVHSELKDNYPIEISSLVTKKLEKLIDNLDYTTDKKSVAIFVSPIFEKVVYLDIPVEKKIIIDESFEIRDLVFSQKQIHKYLILLLTGKKARICLGNSKNFVVLVSETPESLNPVVSDVPERVANFSDSSDRKEIVMDKFLHQVDKSLGNILSNSQLPVFVIGADRIGGHFKKITRHAGAIAGYIHGNYEEASAEQLIEIVWPHISELENKKQNELFDQLEKAAGKKHLAIGIREVWRAAMNNKGRLLLVEKNFMYPAQRGSNEDTIYKLEEPYHKFSYIKDAVDDVIEKVLKNGGDVEFVDEGLLKEYHHIALIQYY
jgi:hypothetical protein